jgi:hypothetical protein
MADATVTLGLDAKQLRSGLESTRRDVEKFSQGANRSIGQIGKQKGIQGGSGIGGVGMQLQDVAVQLQMGTRLSTVFAQQGSQIASSFGTAGIAIGAAIAVFATLYTVGQKNKENFDALVKSSSQLSNSFKSLNAASSFEDIAGGASAAKDQIKLLNEESDRLRSKSGVLADYLGQLFGGDASEVKNEKTDQATGKLMMERVALGKLAVESAKEELRIANLRAQGLTDQADEAQRALDLTRELASIDKLPFTTKTKDDLKEVKTNLSDAVAEAEKLKRAEKTEKDEKKTGADTNGDGFTSKREQRVYDLAQERGQRKADSIKGFSRRAAGLSNFGGLSEFKEMQNMSLYHGGESVGLRWKGVRSTDPIGTVSARDVPNAKGGVDRMVTSLDKLHNLVEQRLTVD